MRDSRWLKEQRPMQLPESEFPLELRYQRQCGKTCICKPGARANQRRRQQHDLAMAKKAVLLLVDLLGLDYQLI
jgi:hypothetical protein